MRISFHRRCRLFLLRSRSLYYFERAAETYVRVLSTGRPFRIMPPEVAELTAQQWESYQGFAENHLAAIMALLDREAPDFRD